MKHRNLLLCSLVAIVVAAGSLGAVASAAPAKAKAPKPLVPEMVPGQVIVKWKATAAESARASAASSVGGSVADDVDTTTQVLKVKSTSSALATLRARTDVEYAEPNYIRRASVVPNDPRFGEQADMNLIGAPQAWTTTTGSSDVVVAVLDTGVDYTHADLKANLWKNPGAINGCPKNTFGFNVVNAAKKCDPADDNEHGTHVSGTIGAAGNNGVGVTGVNWNVKIMAVKVLDASGTGNDAGIAQGIDLVIAAKKAGVNVKAMNASLGGTGLSQVLHAAIARADAAGIAFVAAAGNEVNDNDALPVSPCAERLPNEICVAAVDNHDDMAWFSNFGATTVDVAAPGVDVLSTLPGGGYGLLSGTSMATPHVAGSVALLASVPGCATASPETLKAFLVGTADHTYLPVRSQGRINVASAVATACTGNAPSLPPALPTWACQTAGAAGPTLTPALAATNDGEMLFSRTTTGALHAQRYDGSLHAVAGDVSDFTKVDPVAVAPRNHRVDVFGQNAAGEVTHAWYVSGVLGGTEKLALKVAKGHAPVATTDGHSRIDVFGFSDKTKVVHASKRLGIDSDWSYDNLPGKILGEPVAASLGGDSVIVVAALKKTGMLQSRTLKNGAWTAWKPIPGSDTSAAPIVVSPAPGVAELVISPLDGNIATATFDGSTWTAFRELFGSGYFSTPAAALVRDAHHVDIMENYEGSLYHNTRDTGPQFLFDAKGQASFASPSGNRLYATGVNTKSKIQFCRYEAA